MAQKFDNLREFGMTFPNVLAWPGFVIGPLYLVGYVGLDWLSYVQPFGSFAITPWNPPTGLSLALILLFGQRYVPLLFVAPLAAEALVRQFPAPIGVEFATVGVIGLGYSAAALFLLRPTLRFDVSLSAMRDLALLLAAAAVSACLVAVAFVGVLAIAGLLAWSDFGSAVLRYWVGDMIGIAVVTPFLLILLTRHRYPQPTAETVLQTLAIALALWIIFVVDPDVRLPTFYVLFLPIVWIAVRTGLEGVCSSLFATQLALIAVVHFTGMAIDLTTLQAMMVVLAMTGLAAGILVTERRRAEFQLRIQQEAQARITRLGSMGELAAAMAHELNQPLMAAGTYARIATEGLDEGAPVGSVKDAAHKALDQITRAGQVVRRLRELIRLGRSEIAPIMLDSLIGETVDLLHPELDRCNVAVRTSITPALPPVLADKMQIGQVLMNIVRNGIEAIEGAGHRRGTILIAAQISGDAEVEVRVSDTGPGFLPDQLRAPLTPFVSTKEHGLGIGLSLSRSIVETHGGRLWIADQLGGATVFFTLPIAEESHG